MENDPLILIRNRLHELGWDNRASAIEQLLQQFAGIEDWLVLDENQSLCLAILNWLNAVSPDSKPPHQSLRHIEALKYNFGSTDGAKWDFRTTSFAALLKESASATTNKIVSWQIPHPTPKCQFAQRLRDCIAFVELHATCNEED